jgi:Domain of unknown function.
MSLKQKTFSYWIRIYCYNNNLILPIKRNIKNGITSNLLLLFLSPYILLNYILTYIYEQIYGYKRVENIMKNEQKTKFEYEIGLVSIAKNEGPYLREWIEYHKLVGISKFYFYDNESEDNTAEILKSYIDQGIVEYTHIKGKGMQLNAYNDAIKKHKHRCRYMGFIDLDEYIMPTKPFKSINIIVDEILNNAKKGAAGVGINWALYGSSGHISRPTGLITENYINRGINSHWGNIHIKVICNPRLVKDYISPHYPFYIKGAYSVSECDGKRIIGWGTDKISYTNIRINHYYCKSEEDYIRKVSRGLGDRDGKYDMSRFNEYNLNDMKDEAMLVYQKKLMKNV